MAEDEVASHVPNLDNLKDTSYLSVQDVTKLDPTKISPLTPEIMSRQATINIGWLCLFQF